MLYIVVYWQLPLLTTFYSKYQCQIIHYGVLKLCCESFSVGLSGIEFRSSGRSLARHDIISCDNMVMMYVVLKLINLYPMDVIFVLEY